MKRAVASIVGLMALGVVGIACLLELVDDVARVGSVAASEKAQAAPRGSDAPICFNGTRGEVRLTPGVVVPGGRIEVRPMVNVEKPAEAIFYGLDGAKLVTVERCDDGYRVTVINPARVEVQTR